jgi:hypothetical protein
MVSKLKVKFMPKDYQISLFMRMQNLRQRELTMKEYIGELYKLNIRGGQRERERRREGCQYINGLRYDIQDEISMEMVRTVEDVYQMALKAEEKLARKQSQHNIGRSLNIGKRVSQEKTQKPKDEGEKPHSHSKRGGSSRGRQSGGRIYFPRGRGRGRGGEVRCYAYGKTGHMSWDRLERNKGGEDHISEV